MRAGSVFGLEVAPERKFDLGKILTPQILEDIRRELVKPLLFQTGQDAYSRWNAGVVLGEVMAAAAVLDQVLCETTIPLSPEERASVEQEIRLARIDFSYASKGELGQNSSRENASFLTANANYKLACPDSRDHRLLSDPALEFLLGKILELGKSWRNAQLLELAICRPDQRTRLQAIAEVTQEDLHTNFSSRFEVTPGYEIILDSLQAFLLFCPEQRKDFPFTWRDEARAKFWTKGGFSRTQLLTQASDLTIWLAEDAHLDEHGRILLNQSAKPVAPAQPLPPRLHM